MTPRVILARHGETSWTISGAYTSITDLPLTARGRIEISSAVATTVGKGKPIDPTRLAHIIVSPRLRAKETHELLFPVAPPGVQVTTDERVREWGYGECEGRTTPEIRALRKARGADTEREWDIWVDGAGGEGGESAASVQDRIDAVITDITRAQGEVMRSGADGGDVLIVSHGHFLRAFAKRWVGLELGARLMLVLDPGGVGVLSYAHGKVEERAFVLGGVYD